MISQYDVWIANLNPKNGTEAGKIRPVVIVQTNFLNKINHNSTIICPLTTNIIIESEFLRVNLKKDYANLKEECDIMIDQIRAVDNNRLIERIGKLPKNKIEELKENILVVLDLE